MVRDDLFTAPAESLLEMAAPPAPPRHQPLAARMRPRRLDEYIGQPHILGPGQLLRRAIEADRIQSLIFFGPPGTGFTYDCIRYGLKTRDNQELADLYLAMIGKRCEQLGIALPALTPGYPHAAV